jgi:hypothetical protein
MRAVLAEKTFSQEVIELDDAGFAALVDEVLAEIEERFT